MHNVALEMVVVVTAIFMLDGLGPAESNNGREPSDFFSAFSINVALYLPSAKYEVRNILAFLNMEPLMPSWDGKTCLANLGKYLKHFLVLQYFLKRARLAIPPASVR